MPTDPSVEQNLDERRTQRPTPAERLVSVEVRKQLGQIALILGAANVIAFVGFWLAAVNIAKDQLVSAARNEVPFRNLLDEYVNLATAELENSNKLEKLKTLLKEDEKLADQIHNATPEGAKMMTEAMAKLKDSNIQDLLAKLLAAQSKAQLNFFPSGKIPPRFVVRNGADHDRDRGNKPEPYEQFSDPKGITVDCSAFGVPNTAHGAVVKVLLGGNDKTKSHSAYFVVADPQGGFSGDFGKNWQLANYNPIWIGGIAFCPFFEDQKFKYKLCAEDANPSNEVGCQAAVIGWY
jgi:hypothetical protein